jgi:outer membrane immunogenic protein
MALCTAGNAGAADLPTAKAAPLAPAPVQRAAYSWTGFYVGANVGANITSNFNADAQAGSGFSFHDDNSGLAAATLDTGVGGVAGGVQAGYNYQWGPAVIGAEADISGLSAGGGSSWTSFATLNGSTLTTSASERLDYLGTIRARLGYVLYDRWLVYATGGFAYGQVKNNGSVTMDASPGNQWNSSSTEIRTGYALGGGVAYALTDNISLRLEGFYYSLGAKVSTDVGNAAVRANPSLNGYNLIYKTTTVGDVFRVGVDYKF